MRFDILANSLLELSRCQSYMLEFTFPRQEAACIVKRVFEPRHNSEMRLQERTLGNTEASGTHLMTLASEEGTHKVSRNDVFFHQPDCYQLFFSIHHFALLCMLLRSLCR